jgi:DNA-binding transcriptional LysR family regulator
VDLHGRQVGSGQLDLAIVAVCGPIPVGVHLEPMATDRLVVLTHPDSPIAARTSVSLADLRDETFIGFKPDWAARVLATRAFAAADLPHRVELEVNDVHTMLDLIGQNLGIAIVPAPIAAKRPDTLHATPLHGDLPVWTVAAAVPDRPSPAAAAFLDLLRARRGFTLGRAHPGRQAPYGARPPLARVLSAPNDGTDGWPEPSSNPPRGHGCRRQPRQEDASR